MDILKQLPLPLSEKQPIELPHLTFGVVIVAAGRGERAGTSQFGPKQYRNLASSPVIARTLKAIRSWSATCPVVIVRHADDGNLLERAIGDRPAETHVVVGGATRQASVFEGLLALTALPAPPTHVFIHDAARPFVSPRMMADLVAAIVNEPDRGVVPGLPIAETIKKVDDDGHVLNTVPRNGLFKVQTPQGFRLETIVDVHRRAAEISDERFTDDASLFEWADLPAAIVAGDSRNVKLTYQQDFEDAERMLLADQQPTLPDIRVGHGYDTHQLVNGTHITLCGVDIPHHRALSGHSDADVGLHALTDALLATVAAGDIGTHFPPSDPQWKGAASHVFLRRAAELVSEAGGWITHCDVTLLCETPKIGPHRDAMRAVIGKILALETNRISVKATTNEKIGFIGREEGIAAMATATVGFAQSRNARDER